VMQSIAVPTTALVPPLSPKLFSSQGKAVDSPVTAYLLQKL